MTQTTLLSARIAAWEEDTADIPELEAERARLIGEVAAVEATLTRCLASREQLLKLVAFVEAPDAAYRTSAPEMELTPGPVVPGSNTAPIQFPVGMNGQERIMRWAEGRTEPWMWPAAAEGAQVNTTSCATQIGHLVRAGRLTRISKSTPGTAGAFATYLTTAVFQGLPAVAVPPPPKRQPRAAKPANKPEQKQAMSEPENTVPDTNPLPESEAVENQTIKQTAPDLDALFAPDPAPTGDSASLPVNPDDLPFDERSMLDLLRRNPEGLPERLLIARLNWSTGRGQKAVRNLEAADLIARRAGHLVALSLEREAADD